MIDINDVFAMVSEGIPRVFPFSYISNVMEIINFLHWLQSEEKQTFSCKVFMVYIHSRKKIVIQSFLLLYSFLFPKNK